MKNKLENKIEGAGLKRSPMGILLEALGQQEENFQKIQSFLEGKLKEWLGKEHIHAHIFWPKIMTLFLGVTTLCVSQSKPLKVSCICSVFTFVCFEKRKFLIWRALSLPQGVCHSTQNLSGHFSQTAMGASWRYLTSLLCNMSVFLCNTAAESFLGMKSVFNQSQKQPSVLPVWAQLKLWKQCKRCFVTKNKKCTLDTHHCQATPQAGLFRVFE